MVTWMLLIVYFLQRCEGFNSQTVRVASLCPGQQLVLTCIANRSSILRWAITIPEGNITRCRWVPFTGSRVLTPLNQTLNDNATVTFSFIRTSGEGTLPLISQLVIERVVTNHIHGTKIHCSPFNESDPQVSFLVHVLGSNSQSNLKVNKTEIFGNSDTTVCLEWSKEAEIDGVSHNVTIFPQVDVLNFSNTSVCFIAPYNIAYNVSITSSSCGMYAVSAVLEVYYAKPCSHPLSPDQANSVNIMGIRDPVTEGTIAIFSCSFGQLLIGPNITLCMNNGEWMPDTQEVQCVKACDPPPSPPHGYIISPSINKLTSNSNITFVCQNATPTTEEIHSLSFCDSFGKWMPNPKEFCSRRQVISISVYILIGVGSSTLVLLLSLAVFLTFFCICCHDQKQTSIRNGSANKSPHSQDNIAPIYEDVLPDTMNCQDTDIDLETNVAYSTVKIRS